MPKPFHFKQFSIIQEKSAMKVGTDGVLLGAWAEVENAVNVLDIGAGTGLISLMTAQRNAKAKITALEIDEAAAFECKQNFESSNWATRLQVLNQDLLSFETSERFDLIVSNPPFFNNSFKAENTSRNQARQTETLSFEQLLFKTASLLSLHGKTCFIIPFSEEENFISLAKKYNLEVNKILRVKGNINTEKVRSLLQFSFQKTPIEIDELAIEIARHQYTTDYINLVKAFFLKM